VRVDGSVKTVTAGISTLDDKRHPGIFAKKVDNWRCDPMEGLVKRPASHFITETLGSSFDPEIDVIFSTILNDLLIWVFILPGQGSGGTHLIRVFDEFGIEHDVVPFLGSSYLNTLTGNDSLAFTNIEETIYLGNKNEVILNSSIEELWTKESMLVIKQAPASFSKIKVIWTGSDNVQLAVEHEVPDFITDDTGTNTTATEIGVLIAAIIFASDEVHVQGSTVLIKRADGEYADITATDGANDAVAATLNDETQDINNLPKYAAHDSVVKVRPDKTSDRGQFWMRATAYVETDGEETYAAKKVAESLVEDAVLTVGENIFIQTLHFKGFQRIADPENPGLLPPFGNLVPNTIQAVLINHLHSYAEVGSDEAIIVLVLDEAPGLPENIEFVTIVNQTTGEMVVETQLQQLENDVTWAGITPFDPKDLVVGQTYDVYFEKIEGFFGALPEVVWNECADPALLNYWNTSTLPHVLGINADGSFVTGPQIELGLKNIHSPRARQAGNDDTNPFPEFLNNTINDIGRFQDRLVMLSGETVSMSQTDKAHAWFRDTATQQLAIDPIGIKSTATDSLSLNHIVSHNNDALLFSKNAQYKLIGSIGITSQNAALPQTTSYDNTDSSKPISNASDVFFSVAYSSLFSGMSRFSVDAASDNQDIAVGITNHVQKLIPGNITQITASSTLNIIICLSELEQNTLYIYEYRDHKKDPQQAWSKWIFPEDVTILSINFKENKLQLIINDDSDTPHQIEMRMNQAVTPFMDRVTFLDLLHTATGINTSISIPSGYPMDEPNLKVYQGTDAPNPGAEITGWSVGGGNINLPINLGGGGAAFGYPFRSAFMPSRRWIRDDSGTPQTASKFRITDYGFWAYGDIFNVDILNAPSGWPTQTFTNDNPERDAYHRISFKQRHDEADIEIWTEDPFNSEILQLEWRGTYIKVGRRF